MWTLTSILYVKLGKTELSELKSFILIWGVVLEVFQKCRVLLIGCYIPHDSTMLTDCLLLKLFRNKRKFHLFLKNQKCYTNTSQNIYHIIHWEIDLPVDLLIGNLKLSFLATRCQYRELDLPLDLPMWTLTSILHVKLDKYELSELKSFILIWGVVLGIFRGVGVLRECYIPHDSTMLSDWLLPKLFRKMKIPTFSWRIHNGCQNIL